jgi:heme/copper-type cytochrome/quinol oxidase subunit 3
LGDISVEHSIPLAARRSATGIPTGRLAVWWLLGSEVVLFGGLIVSYLLRRLLYEHWSDSAAHTNTVAGAANTVVLLTSSLFVVLAHHAAEHHKTRQAFWYLWLTIGGGLAFLVIKGVEWGNEIAHGYTLTTNLFWSFYYTATGLHTFHVVVGLLIIAIVSMGVRRARNMHHVELIGIYWHFVDVVWIFLFPLLYIAK